MHDHILHNAPWQIPYGDEGWTDIIQVECSNSHVVGLKSDGTVVSFQKAALGGTQYDPGASRSWDNIQQIAVSNYTTIGLKADGTVLAIVQKNQGKPVCCFLFLAAASAGT